MADAAVLDRALAAAAKGWKVFPTGGKTGKEALVPWQRMATRNERAIRQLFRRRDARNVGLMLPEGTLVIDVDDPAAFAATGLTLPDAPGQQTPRGGFHRFYHANGKAKQQVKAIAGIDTRVGGKGYVCAYEVDRLPDVDRLPEAPDWVYASTRTVKVDFAPTRITETQRNNTLASLAGSMRNRGMTQEAIYAALSVENEARCDPPLADTEVRTIARSVSRYPPADGPDDVTDDDLAALLGMRALADVPLIPPAPLICERYEPSEPSLLYGPGGVGKGRLAAQDIASLTRSGQVVLVVDYEDHEQEWRSRIDQCGGDLSRVYLLAPHSAAWGGPKGTIRDHAPLIRRAALLVGATFLVVDSAVMAVAGIDPSDPRAPQVYSAALQEIGLTSLTIAHVNREHDLRYPFGSVFWHNTARITWSLSDDQHGDKWLQNRKANNRPFLGKYAVTDAPRIAGKATPFYAIERHMPATIADQIAEVLGDEQLDIAGIMRRFEQASPPIRAKRDSVEAALRRNTDMRFEADDSKPPRWGLRA